MRTWIGSLAIAAMTLGFLGATPSDAHAQLRRVTRPGTTTYYNYTPNFNSYPWNYITTVQGNPLLPPGYDPYYGTPYIYPNYNTFYGNPYATPYLSPYYTPTYNYTYSLPSYSYSYGPGYLNYSVTPGYYFFRYR
jgi:hypothetical protein